MTIDEFIEKLKEYRTETNFWEVDIDSNSKHLEIRWVTGGVAGGSCWGTETYPRESDPEPKIEDWLIDFICTVKPNLTFAESRKYAKYWKSDEYYESGWYGNSTDYSIKSVNLNDVFEETFKD